MTMQRHLLEASTTLPTRNDVIVATPTAPTIHAAVAAASSSVASTLVARLMDVVSVSKVENGSHTSGTLMSLAGHHGGDGGGNIDMTVTSSVSSSLSAFAYTTTSAAMLMLDDFNDNFNATTTTATPGQITTEVPYESYTMRPETYMVPIIFILIFLVGVLGNGLLVLVFIRHSAMRNVPNTYIFSLAVADLLVITTSLPFVSIVYTMESWPWGATICSVSEFVKDLSTGVSVFTLTALSSDRYFAIVDPMRKFHAHGGGKRATYLTIAAALSIWLLAALFSIPALYGSHIKNFRVNSNTSFDFCYPFPDNWPKYPQIVVMGRFLVYYLVPLCIIAGFYMLIARHLMIARVPGETQGTLRQVQARKKVAVTVITFVFIFAFCFFPYHLFMMWFYFSTNADADYNAFWHVVRILGFCLSFANSCANPVALYCVSGAFRKHFNRYLLCRKMTVTHRSYTTDTMGPRDTSMTSTLSRRSRRLNQSTIRRPSYRIQETSITSTMLLTTHPSNNHFNNASGGNNTNGNNGHHHQHYHDTDPDRI